MKITDSYGFLGLISLSYTNEPLNTRRRRKKIKANKPKKKKKTKTNNRERSRRVQKRTIITADIAYAFCFWLLQFT